MIEQEISTPGGFKDFAPLVRRATPLGPPLPKKQDQVKRVSPILYVLALPDKDKAPGIKPARFYFDPKSPLIEKEQEWKAKGVCRGKGNSPVGIRMWFPGPGGAQKGKVYCAVCPVKRECDKFAEDNNIEWGIWGGKIRHRLKRTDEEQLVA